MAITKKKKSNKKIVVIGGGTGAFTVLNGLKDNFKNLTAVIAMSDDGGSTGVLREEFGILPPGDIRRALVALAPKEQPLLAELFSYRFEKGSGLSGHAFGNLMIAALERITGSFESAVEEAGTILNIQGRVLPVTLKQTQIVTLLEDGRVLKGESSLNATNQENWSAVKKVWLTPQAKINPRAKSALLGADCIVIGPGDIYTSIFPNLLVGGMRDALRKTKATIVYIVNVTTRYSETAGFKASDFLRVIEGQLGKGIIDYIIINKNKPNAVRMKPYIEQKAEFVEVDLQNLGPNPIPIITDLVRKTGLVRHDPKKLAKVIKMIV